MKKLVSVIAVILLLFMAASAWAAGEISVYVNNVKVSFPDQKPFIDKNNRTLVPVRFVSEALGAIVDWEGTTQTVTIKHRANTIKLKIGESKATVNDKTKTFDTKAILQNGRTMVPLRFISETLGAQVVWIAKTSTVKITLDNGYTLPENPSVVIEMPIPSENPNKVDIVLTVKLGKELEPQFNDVYSILESKFGAEPAKEITDYIRQKKDRWSEVPSKLWTYNNQRIEAGSNSGDYVVNVFVWQPGVK